MPDTQAKEAVEAAEQIAALVNVVLPPDKPLQGVGLFADIIQENIAPLLKAKDEAIEAGFKEGHGGCCCEGVNPDPHDAWLHSKAYAALGKDGG